MRVIISQTVRNDIREIAKYISQDSQYYAEKTSDAIYDKIDLLKSGIYIGRKVPELNNENIRELIYKDYRIIFKIQSGTAYIQTVIHGAREFKVVYNNKFNF